MRYRLSERANALLFVEGEQRVRSRFRPLADELAWYGRVGGRALPAGTYQLVLAAVDPAGNRGEAAPFRVTIRYVALAREQVRARVRTRFGIRVQTDAKSFRWRFARRNGDGEARPAGVEDAQEARPLHALRERERPRRQGRRRGGQAPAASAAPLTHPLIVLGVSRSGTTLLRVMLDRNSELAVPDESYFVPQLARAAPRPARPRRVPRRPSPAADAARVGALRRRRRAPASARDRRWARPSPASTRRMRPSTASDVGATRRRCTCSTSACSTASGRTRATSTSSATGATPRRLVPRHAPGDRHADVGASGKRGRLRLPVASRGGGRTRARPQGRSTATTSCATRRSCASRRRRCARSASSPGSRTSAAMLGYVGERRPVREAAPAAPRAGADPRRPRLAERDVSRGRRWRSKASPATFSPSWATRRPARRPRDARRRPGGRDSRATRRSRPRTEAPDTPCSAHRFGAVATPRSRDGVGAVRARGGRLRRRRERARNATRSPFSEK